MKIEYQGDIYRDDRIYVMNLRIGKIIKKFHLGLGANNQEELECWMLGTYRNTLNLPPVSNRAFMNLEEAKKYIEKIEHTVPLISKDGEPFDYQRKPDQEIKTSRKLRSNYLTWIRSHNLFSTLDGYPNDLKQNCPYYFDERGYMYESGSNVEYRIIDGEEELYFDSGTIHSKTQYVGGLKHGQCLTYHENGQLEQIRYFKNDLDTGPYERYHSNGKLRSSGRLEDGLQVGHWKWFDDNGNLTKERDFN